MGGAGWVGVLEILGGWVGVQTPPLPPPPPWGWDVFWCIGADGFTAGTYWGGWAFAPEVASRTVWARGATLARLA